MEQINTHNLKDIEEYFETFCKLVEWFGLASEDILNIDETGFWISYGKAQWVITNDGSMTLVMKVFDNWEYIISDKLINEVGSTIPAFLILQGKHTLQKCILYNNLCHKTSLGTSSEYSNDNLVMDWFRHFDKYSVKIKWDCIASWLWILMAHI